MPYTTHKCLCDCCCCCCWRYLFSIIFFFFFFFCFRLRTILSVCKRWQLNNKNKFHVIYYGYCHFNYDDLCFSVAFSACYRILVCQYIYIFFRWLNESIKSWIVSHLTTRKWTNETVMRIDDEYERERSRKDEMKNIRKCCGTSHTQVRNRINFIISIVILLICLYVRLRLLPLCWRALLTVFIIIRFDHRMKNVMRMSEWVCEWRCTKARENHATLTIELRCK